MTKTNLRECRSCHQKYDLAQMGSYYTEGSIKRRWRCKPGFGCLASDAVIEDCDSLDFIFGDIEDPEIIPNEELLTIGKVFVITSAVSNAVVNEDFLKCLKLYCDVNNAELKVRLISYKMPGEELIWDKKIQQYGANSEENLNDNLILAGDFDVLPTAVIPLSGLQNYGKDKSLIIGHPKVQLQTVATPGNKLPKLQMTTGAITKPNYRVGKAGCAARFHASFSAVVVEIQDNTIFHARHIHFNGEGFYDLNKFYGVNGEVEDSNAAALVLGDIHARFACPQTFDGTFARPDSLAQLTKPENIILHDLLDHSSRNHHTIDDPFNNISLYKAGKENVKDEVIEAIEFVSTCNDFVESKYLIISSNHNDALSKWVKTTDWKTDPVNSEFYLETALMISQSCGYSDSGVYSKGAFDLWIDKLMPETVDYQIIGRSESHQIAGIEVSYHGDKGANGSRGSIRQFARSGTKCVIGHSHNPQIHEGSYQVGTSSILNMGYTIGSLSSWLNTHCLIHPDGKRQLINLINGEFTIKR